MIITFCGHSDFYESGDIRTMLMDIIKELANGENIEFFLGGYGKFDAFAYSVAKEYKKTYGNAKLVFVSPYQTESYLKNRVDDYDESIYPLENKVPPKFAISYRNKWMAEKADAVIAYVKRENGGAYQTLKHAEKSGKMIINIAKRT